MAHFRQIPVLHQGRLKPLHTFAEHYLSLFNGRGVHNASYWLAQSLFAHREIYGMPLFYIGNREVVEALSLPPAEDGLYSLSQILAAAAREEDLINALLEKEAESLAPRESAILEAYSSALQYYEISRSLSAITDDFIVASAPLRERWQLRQDKIYNYHELSNIADDVLAQARTVGERFRESDAALTDADKELLLLAFQMDMVRNDNANAIFRVIPPQWQDAPEEWLSPHRLIQLGRGSPESVALFQLWRDAARAWREGDAARWEAVSGKLLAQTSAYPEVSSMRLRLEVLYNQLRLFEVSLALYLAAALMLVFGWFIARRLERWALTLFAVGFGGHLVGLIARVVILQRPPVATLYESIIFVGLVAVFFALCYEYSQKNQFGLFSGAILGSILHFVGIGYAGAGDTMGMLVAVLNTNFWLATHVVCITIGYGCSLLAGFGGHLWLIRAAFAKGPYQSDASLIQMHRHLLGITLFAAFFSMFGTILGGIWADQSWGRFWGWDPKENGALLLVLWLFFLLHGHIAKLLGPLGFALGLVLTNIIVALAWFGVNLLNVGLHSYGFTEGIANNLAAFILVELSFAGYCALLFRIRRRRAS